jgi:hypothetical protein
MLLGRLVPLPLSQNTCRDTEGELVMESATLKKFAKGGLIQPTLQVCFQLLSTCMGDADDEEDADDDERDVG